MEEFGDNVATDGVKDAVEEVVEDKDDDKFEIESEESASQTADFVIFREISVGEPGQNEGGEDDDSIIKERETSSRGGFLST